VQIIVPTRQMTLHTFDILVAELPLTPGSTGPGCVNLLRTFTKISTEEVKSEDESVRLQLKCVFACAGLLAVLELAKK